MAVKLPMDTWMDTSISMLYLGPVGTTAAPSLFQLPHGQTRFPSGSPEAAGRVKKGAPPACFERRSSWPLRVLSTADFLDFSNSAANCLKHNGSKTFGCSQCWCSASPPSAGSRGFQGCSQTLFRRWLGLDGRRKILAGLSAGACLSIPQ